MKKLNSRVLVIDDDQDARENIRASILYRTASDRGLESARANLFGTETGGKSEDEEAIEFGVFDFSTGEEGYQFFRESFLAGNPIAVVFLDIRMLGWNGLDTARNIRKIDTRAEIVFVTAYSEYRLEDMQTVAGVDIGLFCKPFAPADILQAAVRAVRKWNQAWSEDVNMR